MPKDGSKTKKKIIDEATSLVLRNGFAGTTLDLVLEKTGITKGAFFYHFKNKADLALHMMNSFAQADLAHLNDVLYKTSNEESPKERLVKFVQYFINLMKPLDEPYPGCLYASYIYEPDQFDGEIGLIVSTTIMKWREELYEIMKDATPDDPNTNSDDLNALADQFTVILEGAFIVSKALSDGKLIYKQLVHYQNYLRYYFK